LFFILLNPLNNTLVTVEPPISACNTVKTLLSPGILPPDVAGVNGKVLGFQSNGKILRYTNCVGSKDNLFAFLPDHSELSPSDNHSDNLIYEREGMAVNWRNTSVLPPSGRTMPNSFFFLTEVHMGGCGCYTSSDRWTDALGTAIGFR